MSFRPEEVSAVLAQELERYEAKLETKSVGTVLSVGDGIARLWGLEDAMAGELLRFPGDIMGLVLNLMAETGKKLSELVAELPAYHIVKDKYTVSRDHLPQLFADLEKKWPEARVNRLDGLRLDWPDRWLHVRPSNTEPIVRVIAEAPAVEEAEELCREMGVLLKK